MPSTAATRARETAATVAWVAAALVLVLARNRLPPAALFTLAAALVLGLALLARRGWLRLFGPVLFYDLVRSGRRARYFVLRCLYALGLFLLLLWVYSLWEASNPGRDRSVGDQSQAQVQLAEQVFLAYAVAQFVAVCVLTPAYVAGAVAEEKERRTLEFLLATDLRNREIVFGKLAARVGNLALFLLTGLPILSLMQVFGGIDPNLLLASFAVTGLTMASLAGVSILNSVMRRRARDAIVLTYLAAVGYLGVAGLSLGLLAFLQAMKWVTPVMPPVPITLLGRDLFAFPLTVADFINVFNYGNPFVGLYEVSEAIDRNRVLSDTLGEVLGKYAAFHGTLAAACVAWAVLRLRAVALRQAAGPVRRSKSAEPKARRRKPVGDEPMLWKEVRVEAGLRLGRFGRAFVALMVAVSLVPVGLIAYYCFVDVSGRTYFTEFPIERFRSGLNVWVRVMTVILGLLFLLGVAVRAAGSVGGERDRDTLDGLLTTPLSGAAILAAKWVGALLSARGFALWLALVWALGVLTGSVHVLALPLLAVGLLPPAAFAAALGLWFSATSRTTLRATLGTLLTAVMFCGGHWVCMGMCCYMPLAVAGSGAPDVQYVATFEAALSPPFVLGWLPFREFGDLELSRDSGMLIAFVLFGAVLWCGAAAVLGNLAHERFQQLTHRGTWARGKPPAETVATATAATAGEPGASAPGGA
jgi:ABC-type transport system involved in multi-copper enzyme maturation permease subunit